jgi:hypothetical protein
MSSFVVDLRLYPIDTSRKSASEGCMVIAPNDAKNTAICSCAPSEIARIVALGLVGCAALLRCS